MGQRASTGLVQFNQFFSYVMPMIGEFSSLSVFRSKLTGHVGGWLADEYWGKFKTIYVAIVVATLGHILIIIAAIPQVIATPKGALASCE